MTNIENKQGVVSFGSLTVRKYDLTLGDSPSVSSGLPLSLDWTYRQRQPVSIETYEANRRPRRSEESLKMSPERRHKMLVEEFGVSSNKLLAPQGARSQEQVIANLFRQRDHVDGIRPTTRVEYPWEEDDVVP
eukprot:CAMPEP_0116842710 /NCGR_PEP_ID=MMETSP0418-20121206/11671_1 /TAXON_ID=1158023 /ORGANISM="Astrosyne radiata, Strain 13vi08-1A" /LENGTH=132 /DNA_ID=CAMNT_0004473357 /DNA_START=199 /DNA_END=598 /DNA_ORIENTATION=+